MSELTVHVGRKIKLFRKIRGLSVDQLAERIHKSKATVYKYENGEIAVDTNVLADISAALKVEPTYFFDLPSAIRDSQPRISFLNTSKLYTYYYDGRIRRVVKSLLSIRQRTGEKDESEDYKVSFFMNLKDFSQPEVARYIYSGFISSHEMVSYCILDNITLPIETLVIQLIHPFQTSLYTWGLFMGLSDQPLAPMTTKILISKTPLTAQELEEYPLMFTKEELKRIRQQNAILLSIRE